MMQGILELIPAEWRSLLVLGQSSATLVALAWLVRTVRRVAPWVRRGARLMDDLQGEPARHGRPAQPGVLERLNKLEARLDAVSYHVAPNSGGSAHDQIVKRLERIEAIAEHNNHPTPDKEHDHDRNN